MSIRPRTSAAGTGRRLTPSDLRDPRDTLAANDHYADTMDADEGTDPIAPVFQPRRAGSVDYRRMSRNPSLQRLHEDDMRRADYADALDERRARIAAADYADQQREAHRAEKDRREAIYNENKIVTYTDASGMLQPKKHKDGRIVYRPHQSDEQSDDEGRPFVEKTDEFGNKRLSYLDQRIAEDPATGKLRRVHSVTGDFTTDVDPDRALASKNPAEVSAAAKHLQTKAENEFYAQAGDARLEAERIKNELDSVKLELSKLPKDFGFTGDPNSKQEQLKTRRIELTARQIETAKKRTEADARAAAVKRMTLSEFIKSRAAGEIKIPSAPAIPEAAKLAEPNAVSAAYDALSKSSAELTDRIKAHNLKSEAVSGKPMDLADAQKQSLAVRASAAQIEADKEALRRGSDRVQAAQNKIVAKQGIDMAARIASRFFPEMESGDGKSAPLDFVKPPKSDLLRKQIELQTIDEAEKMLIEKVRADYSEVFGEPPKGDGASDEDIKRLTNRADAIRGITGSLGSQRTDRSADYAAELTLLRDRRAKLGPIKKMTTDEMAKFARDRKASAEYGEKAQADAKSTAAAAFSASLAAVFAETLRDNGQDGQPRARGVLSAAAKLADIIAKAHGVDGDTPEERMSRTSAAFGKAAQAKGKELSIPAKDGGEAPKTQLATLALEDPEIASAIAELKTGERPQEEINAVLSDKFSAWAERMQQASKLNDEAIPALLAINKNHPGARNLFQGDASYHEEIRKFYDQQEEILKDYPDDLKAYARFQAAADRPKGAWEALNVPLDKWNEAISGIGAVMSLVSSSASKNAIALKNDPKLVELRSKKSDFANLPFLGAFMERPQIAVLSGINERMRAGKPLTAWENDFLGYHAADQFRPSTGWVSERSEPGKLATPAGVADILGTALPFAAEIMILRRPTGAAGSAARGSAALAFKGAATAAENFIARQGPSSLFRRASVANLTHNIITGQTLANAGARIVGGVAAGATLTALRSPVHIANRMDRGAIPGVQMTLDEKGKLASIIDPHWARKSSGDAFQDAALAEGIENVSELSGGWVAQALGKSRSVLVKALGPRAAAAAFRAGAAMRKMAAKTNLDDLARWMSAKSGVAGKIASQTGFHGWGEVMEERMAELGNIALRPDAKEERGMLGALSEGDFTKVADQMMLEGLAFAAHGGLLAIPANIRQGYLDRAFAEKNETLINAIGESALQSNLEFSETDVRRELDALPNEGEPGAGVMDGRVARAQYDSLAQNFAIALARWSAIQADGGRVTPEERKQASDAMAKAGLARLDFLEKLSVAATLRERAEQRRNEALSQIDAQTAAQIPAGLNPEFDAATAQIAQEDAFLQSATAQWSPEMTKLSQARRMAAVIRRQNAIESMAHPQVEPEAIATSNAELDAADPNNPLLPTAKAAAAIAAGGIDTLTDAELATVGLTRKDGVISQGKSDPGAGVTMHNGKPVFGQGSIDAIAASFPETAKLLPSSEQAQRASIDRTAALDEFAAQDMKVAKEQAADAAAEFKKRDSSAAALARKAMRQKRSAAQPEQQAQQPAQQAAPGQKTYAVTTTARAGSPERVIVVQAGSAKEAAKIARSKGHFVKDENVTEVASPAPAPQTTPPQTTPPAAKEPAAPQENDAFRQYFSRIWGTFTDDAKKNGITLTAEHLQTAQKLTKELLRHSKLISEVFKGDIRALAVSTNTAGLAVSTSGGKQTLVISLSDMTDTARVVRDLGKWMESALYEEVIHAIAKQLKIPVGRMWETAPKDVQEAVLAAYAKLTDKEAAALIKQAKSVGWDAALKAHGGLLDSSENAGDEMFRYVVTKILRGEDFATEAHYKDRSHHRWLAELAFWLRKLFASLDKMLAAHPELQGHARLVADQITAIETGLRENAETPAPEATPATGVPGQGVATPEGSPTRSFAGDLPEQSPQIQPDATQISQQPGNQPAAPAPGSGDREGLAIRFLDWVGQNPTADHEAKALEMGLTETEFRMLGRQIAKRKAAGKQAKPRPAQAPVTTVSTPAPAPAPAAPAPAPQPASPEPEAESEEDAALAKLAEALRAIQNPDTTGTTPAAQNYSSPMPPEVVAVAISFATAVVKAGNASPEHVYAKLSDIGLLQYADSIWNLIRAMSSQPGPLRVQWAKIGQAAANVAPPREKMRGGWTTEGLDALSNAQSEAGRRFATSPPSAKPAFATASEWRAETREAAEKAALDAEAQWHEENPLFSEGSDAEKRFIDNLRKHPAAHRFFRFDPKTRKIEGRIMSPKTRLAISRSESENPEAVKLGAEYEGHEGTPRHFFSNSIIASSPDEMFDELNNAYLEGDAAPGWNSEGRNSDYIWEYISGMVADAHAGAEEYQKYKESVKQLKKQMREIRETSVLPVNATAEDLRNDPEFENYQRLIYQNIGTNVTPLGKNGTAAPLSTLAGQTLGTPYSIQHAIDAGMLEKPAPNAIQTVPLRKRMKAGREAPTDQEAVDLWDEQMGETDFLGTTPAEQGGLSTSDAAYLDAVKRGDMETAQRMVDEAARQLGLIKAWHGFRLGMKGDFFDPDKQLTGEGTAWFGDGSFSFGSTEKTARGYAGSKGEVKRFYIPKPSRIGFSSTAQNVLEVEPGVGVVAGYHHDADGKGWLTDEEKANVNKGIGIREIAEKYGDLEEYAVFDNRQIKSADPITYDEDGNVIPLSQRFNTESDDIRRSVSPSVPGYARRARYLTEQERSKMRRDVAEKFVEIFDTLPPAQEMAAVALGGVAKRGWYRRSSTALLDVFGPDAPRFAALLASLSPQASVQQNLRNALSVWKNWIRAGRPTDEKDILTILGLSVERTPLARMSEEQLRRVASKLRLTIPATTTRHGIAGPFETETTAGDIASLIADNATDEQIARLSVLGAWENNTVRSLTAVDPENLTLSGQKVNSFMLNLLGNTTEVTNDAWLANYALVDQKIFSGTLSKSGPGKGPGYLAMSAKARAAAEYLTKLTGEQWTPAEVQETVWSWAKTLYELQLPSGEDRTALELLRGGEVTEERIAATPDFAILLLDETYRKILEESGYAEQLRQLDRSHPKDSGVGRYRSEREASAATSPAAQRAREKAAKRLTLLREQRASSDTQRARLGWDDDSASVTGTTPSLLREGGEELQGYFDFHSVPQEKQDHGTTKQIVKTISTPKAKRGVRQIESERMRAERAWKGLIGGDPSLREEALRALEHGPVSALLHDLVSREIPSWDIRGAVIDTPADLHALALAVRSPFIETLKIVVVDGRNRVIGSRIITVGSLNETTASAREMVAALDSIMAGHKGKVGGFFISHNHPSGDPSPSHGDRTFTRRLLDVADLYGIPLIDHVVTNGKSYFSFREAGLMSGTPPHHPQQGWSRMAQRPDWQKAMARPDTAEWEVVARHNLPIADSPELLRPLFKTIRAADPSAHHIIYLSTRMTVLAVERLDASGGVESAIRAVISGIGREGAAKIALNSPHDYTSSHASRINFKRIKEAADLAGATIVDHLFQLASGEVMSAAELGLLEAPAEYKTTGTTPAGDAAYLKALQTRKSILRISDAERTVAQKNALRLAESVIAQEERRRGQQQLFAESEVSGQRGGLAAPIKGDQLDLFGEDYLARSTPVKQMHAASADKRIAVPMLQDIISRGGTYAPLASAILSVPEAKASLEAVTVELPDEKDAERASVYKPNTHVISIHPRDVGIDRVFLHEALHAVTTRKLPRSESYPTGAAYKKELEKLLLDKATSRPLRNIISLYLDTLRVFNLEEPMFSHHKQARSMFMRVENGSATLDQESLLEILDALMAAGLQSGTDFVITPHKDRKNSTLTIKNTPRTQAVKGFPKNPASGRKVLTLNYTTDTNPLANIPDKMYDAGIPYGLANIHEFMTEAFTRPSFQQLLREVKSRNGSGKSLWQKFISAIADFLGLNTDAERTLLEDVIDASVDLMQQGKGRGWDRVKGFSGTTPLPPMAEIAAMEAAAATESPGSFTIGNPELSRGADDEPTARAVADVWTRMAEATPQTHAAWFQSGLAKVTADPGAVGLHILNAAANGNALEPDMQKALDILLQNEYRLYHARPSAQRLDYIRRLEWASRVTGRAASYALGARVDPFLTPFERNLRFLQNLVYSPTQQGSAALSSAKSRVEAQKIYDMEQKLLEKLRKDFAKVGTSLDKVLSGGVELSLKGTQAETNALARLDDDKARVVEMLRALKPMAEIKKKTGLSEAQIREIRDELDAAIATANKEMIVAKLRADKAERLASEAAAKKAMGGQDDAGLTRSTPADDEFSEEEILAAAKEMSRMMGFPTVDELETVKVKKVVRRKKGGAAGGATQPQPAQPAQPAAAIANPVTDPLEAAKAKYPSLFNPASNFTQLLDSIGGQNAPAITPANLPIAQRVANMLAGLDALADEAERRQALERAVVEARNAAAANVSPTYAEGRNLTGQGELPLTGPTMHAAAGGSAAQPSASSPDRRSEFDAWDQGVQQDIAANGANAAANELVEYMMPVDLSDPHQVIRLARMVQSARPNNYLDMAIEAYLSVSLLSGATTFAVNMASNAFSAAWVMGIERAGEALINAAMLNKAPMQATFGEMRWMAKYGLSPKGALKALRELGKEKDRETFLKDLKHILNGLSPALMRGMEHAISAFQTEYDLTEHEMLGGSKAERAKKPKLGASGALAHTVMEGRTAAIRGTLDIGRFSIPLDTAGKIIRIPLRALMSADSFYKAAIATIEAASFAYRIAKAAGVSGADLEYHITDQLNTPGSDAWQMGLNKAKELIFQKDLPTIVQAISDFRFKNWFTKILAAIYMPFVKTPFNIVRFGFKIGVAAPALLGRDIYRASKAVGRNASENRKIAEVNRMAAEGMSDKEIATVMQTSQHIVAGYRHGAEESQNWLQAAFYASPEMLTHLVRTMIGFGLAKMLWAMVEGDDDDDQKQVLMTGSGRMGRSEKDSAVRAMRSRLFGGDYVIRYRKRDGTFGAIPYGRLEPAATVLGNLVDTIRTLKSKADPVRATAQLGGWMMSQIVSKTAFQGFENFQNAVRTMTEAEPAQMDNMSRKTQQSLVRALSFPFFAQVMRSDDPYFRDTRSADLMHSLFPTGDYAAPRVSMATGEPLEKAGTFTSRLISGTAAKPEGAKVDRLLDRWNKRNPSDEWAKGSIDRKMAFTLPNGVEVRVPLNKEEFHDGNENMARLAATYLRNLPDSAVANPTRADVEAVKDAYKAAGDIAREQLRRRVLERRPEELTEALKKLAPAP